MTAAAPGARRRAAAVPVRWSPRPVRAANRWAYRSRLVGDLRFIGRLLTVLAGVLLILRGVDAMHAYAAMTGGLR